MDKFVKLSGLAAPLLRANIDTDQIIPKQFLTRIERTGYGAFLFNDWRFDSNGNKSLNFALNDPKFKDASILIAGANFGCGSSREHAAWSLLDHGFRVIIAPSFGDIFYNNSLKNGLLPVRLPENIISELAERASEGSLNITVDLMEKTISDPDSAIASFEIDDFRRHCLIEGLDDIGLTLQHASAIDTYEKNSPQMSRFIAP